MTTELIKARLEYLRGELRTEQISYAELHELQSLAEHIESGDVELLEAAGVGEMLADKNQVRLVKTAMVTQIKAWDAILDVERAFDCEGDDEIAELIKAACVGIDDPKIVETLDVSSIISDIKAR